jgi:hypothetical protein
VQEITLGYDPDQLAAIVHYRQAADFFISHQLVGILHGHLRGDRDNRAGHSIANKHISFSLSCFFC